MLQGTPPTVMLRSKGWPVSRFRPVIVRDVPPAFGPLSGDTPITNGSWEDREEGRRGLSDLHQPLTYTEELIINQLKGQTRLHFESHWTKHWLFTRAWFYWRIYAHCREVVFKMAILFPICPPESTATPLQHTTYTAQLTQQRSTESAFEDVSSWWGAHYHLTVIHYCNDNKLCPLDSRLV